MCEVEASHGRVGTDKWLRANIKIIILNSWSVKKSKYIQHMFASYKESSSLPMFRYA
jgi:hypothetical protein